MPDYDDDATLARLWARADASFPYFERTRSAASALRFLLRTETSLSTESIRRLLDNSDALARLERRLSVARAARLAPHVEALRAGHCDATYDGAALPQDRTDAFAYYLAAYFNESIVAEAAAAAAAAAAATRLPSLCFDTERFEQAIGSSCEFFAMSMRPGHAKSALGELFARAYPTRSSDRETIKWLTTHRAELAADVRSIVLASLLGTHRHARARAPPDVRAALLRATDADIDAWLFNNGGDRADDERRHTLIVAALRECIVALLASRLVDVRAELVARTDWRRWQRQLVDALDTMRELLVDWRRPTALDVRSLRVPLYCVEPMPFENALLSALRAFLSGRTRVTETLERDGRVGIGLVADAIFTQELDELLRAAISRYPRSAPPLQPIVDVPANRDETREALARGRFPLTLFYASPLTIVHYHVARLAYARSPTFDRVSGFVRFLALTSSYQVGTRRRPDLRAFCLR